MSRRAFNTTDSFGWVTRTLHWLMAVGIIAMLGLGTFIHQMQPSLSNLWLYGLHKSVGLSLLALVLSRLIWHRVTPPPRSLTTGIAKWQITASHIVHRTLYALMVIVPLTGWIASSATGIDVVIFETITLPAIAPASETWENLFFLLHGVLTKILLLLIVLHIAGALQRHFVRRDKTLLRMLRGG
jgi:cytochrome b561